MSEWSKVQTIPEGMTILPYQDRPNADWVLREEAEQRIEELEAEIVQLHNPHTGEECECDVCQRNRRLTASKIS